MAINREINILRYWSPILRDVLEFQELAAAENPEFKILWDELLKVWDNQYLDTLDEVGCERWEKMLKITPQNADTITDRRFKIKTLFNGDLPYTWKSLYQKLLNLCEGEDTVDMSYSHDDFILTVRIALKSKRHLEEARAMLEKIVPANIIIDINLAYNTYETLKAYRHEDLQPFVHTKLRNEVLN